MQTGPQQAPLAGVGTPSTLPTSVGAQLALRDLIDAYMAAYAGRDPTRVTYLAWWLEQLGADRQAFGVTDEEIFRALEKLRATPAQRYDGKGADGAPVYRVRGPRSAASVNRYHAALMALYTWAIKQRRAPRGWDNPARRVSRIPERNQVVRFLTEDERTRLLEACRSSSWPRLYCLVLMAITTGARKGELLSLTWGGVDFERGIALVHETKNGESRALPLTPALLAELERFRVDRPEVCVFPARSRLTAPRAFESSWLYALKVAKVKRFRFHDLRHTAASYLAQSGASLLEIADFMGHRQLAMVKRYAHLTVDTKAKLVNRVLGGIK